MITLLATKPYEPNLDHFGPPILTSDADLARVGIDAREEAARADWPPPYFDSCDDI
jgi:hypothetical protein